MTKKKQCFIAFFIHQWKVREVTKEQSLLQKGEKEKEKRKVEREKLRTIIKIHVYFWTN